VPPWSEAAAKNRRLQILPIAGFPHEPRAIAAGRGAVRLCSICCVFLLLVVVDGVAAGDLLPEWESWATPFGPMRVREFGSSSKPLVILVHGITDSDFIRSEFNPVALKLAIDGFHVLVPDFHSAPATLRPDKLTGEVLRELLTGTLAHRNEFVPSRYRTVVRPKMVVMGKSWGARMAAEAGALEEVIGVALVVPALGKSAVELIPRIRGELAVLLVRDDPVVDFADASALLKSAIADRVVTWRVAATGGHRVLDEFVRPLVDFVAKVRRSFTHGAEDAEEL